MSDEDKWQIQGNDQRAKDLLNFLRFCDVKKITPISPISQQENQISLINTEAYFKQIDFASYSYNLPENWVASEGFFKRALQQGDSGKNVVSLLKELDSVGLALPNLPSIIEVPAAIGKRVQEIEFDTQTKKLSELLKEKTELLFSSVLKSETYNQDIPIYTSCCVDASKAFAKKSGNRVYRGIYDFFRRKNGTNGPLVRGIEISIPGDLVLDKNALDTCPVQPVRTDTYIRKDKLFAPKDLFFCDKDTGTRYQLTVRNREMVLKKEEELTCSSIKGIKYAPGRTFELEKMEALADWVVRNNAEKGGGGGGS